MAHEITAISGETHESATWLTRLELAARWRIPKATLDQWGSRKIGPPFAKFGRHCRYRLSDVIAWEVAQTADPLPRP